MTKESAPYRTLCTEYYELERPKAPENAIQFYLQYAEEAKGSILEPMCGSGRFLIPLLERGHSVTGFDYSSFMLDVCRKKCEELGLKCILQEATFEAFSLSNTYNLIFIPSGSFCHLITPQQITHALNLISSRLNSGGKFVFEVETLEAVRQPQGIWKGGWVNKPDGSKIVRHILSQFDQTSRIETALFRYELWEENTISRTEVESFHLKLYEPFEIEQLLEQHGLKIIGTWQAEPYSKTKVINTAALIVYDCLKV